MKWHLVSHLILHPKATVTSHFAFSFPLNCSGPTRLGSPHICQHCDSLSALCWPRLILKHPPPPPPPLSILPHYPHSLLYAVCC